MAAAGWLSTLGGTCRSTTEDRCSHRAGSTGNNAAVVAYPLLQVRSHITSPSIDATRWDCLTKRKLASCLHALPEFTTFLLFILKYSPISTLLLLIPLRRSMTVTVKLPDGHEGNDQARNTSAEKARSRNKYLQFLSEQWLVFCFALACLFAWRWPSKNSKHPPSTILS